MICSSNLLKASLTVSQMGFASPISEAAVMWECACSGFGELALLYSSPRAASVLAITDCKLWVMERTVYMAIKRTYQEQLAALKRKMVASVPILAVLSEVAVCSVRFRIRLSACCSSILLTLSL